MSAEVARGGDAPRRGDPPPAPPALPVPAIDSHCHLDLMESAVEDTMAAARAVGVARVVTIGIDVASSQWCADVAAARDDVWAAVAIHPNEAPDADEAAWSAITDLAAGSRVVAVGETGLDRFRTAEEGWPAQEESFRRHIAIAKTVGKAVMIHDREAHREVADILAGEGAPEGVIFHCFSGDGAFARECADAGYVMSFAGNITFKNAHDLREAVVVAPLEQILVETDAPFLTPTPYRGAPNAPYLIPLTVRAIAELKGRPVDEVASAVTANAARVFGWE